LELNVYFTAGAVATALNVDYSDMAPYLIVRFFWNLMFISQRERRRT
jgi:hypothetical protein